MGSWGSGKTLGAFGVTQSVNSPPLGCVNILLDEGSPCPECAGGHLNLPMGTCLCLDRPNSLRNTQCQNKPRLGASSLAGLPGPPHSRLLGVLKASGPWRSDATNCPNGFPSLLP